MGYNYYDTPDGQDCFKKLWFTTKIAGVTGLAISAVDVKIHSHTQGFYPTAARFVHFTFPFIGIAAAFTATTCMLTNLRHKDDKLNYFLGGCAAGSVFGAWRKSVVAGVVASAFFGVAAFVKKSSLEEGWELAPEPKLRTFGSVFSSRHDYTLTKPPPKLWKTQEE
ncbi:hypothetical protein L9F63_023285 [Diploptera punctata]|uniref:NADH dehydrogenase [ubiquinone] 1 alpha subcomplex subunit 11 n=1 Tax=Diploptera punctata TaxID=6984 RepID=A0AAD7ZJI7_DIPPU|nr:hypothetical protein L9F63_023285 [Diploptera punctata]